jgi:hypothetical protein
VKLSLLIPIALSPGNPWDMKLEYSEPQGPSVGQPQMNLYSTLRLAALTWEPKRALRLRFQALE